MRLASLCGRRNKRGGAKLQPFHSPSRVSAIPPKSNGFRSLASPCSLVHGESADILIAPGRRGGAGLARDCRHGALKECCPIEGSSTARRKLALTLSHL